MIKRNKETAAVAAIISALTFVLLSAFTGSFQIPYRGSLASVQGSAAAGERIAPPVPGEDVIIGTIERTNPSVVSIVVSRDVPIVERYYRQFGPFPVFVPDMRELGRREIEVGGGSGFIAAPDGLVVTNKHVVDDKEATYAVFTNDGEKYDAEIVALDPYFDIAFLRIKGAGPFPHLEFGDSDSLRLGQTVIAIGNALSEFRNSVSVGVISGLSRSIVAGDSAGRNSELLEQVIQTDAAINPGNSGGPLLDVSGKVIGINVAVARESENIGFALPGNLAENALKSLREQGAIVRPYLGVRTVPVTPAVKEEFGLSSDAGALVRRGENVYEVAVVPDSPAHKAGIREGDVIVSIDGEEIRGDTSLAQIIRRRSVGDEVSVDIERAGKRLAVRAILERLPSE